ncbi:MAG TPA: apolipoprotein N-acyltransferase [Campylobacterales bacterium]|nr:apolipoprotein N-acyltransferase [Campylobacterales bacterium]
MGDYFTIKNITAGLGIALLSAGAIHLDWVGWVNPLVNTILGLLTFYWLLMHTQKIWFWAGFGIGVTWFWWLGLSFANYGLGWAVPLIIPTVGLVYGVLFLMIAKVAEWSATRFHYPLLDLGIKALGLLLLSYVHPLSFDWFKPELVFTNSYVGIQKWQFALVLAAIVLAIHKRNLLFLLVAILAYPLNTHLDATPLPKHSIVIANSMTTMEDKWNPSLRSHHIDRVFKQIDRAIAEKKRLIIFPESIFAFFLNMEPELMTALEAYSNEISIVTGALYWDPEGVPRNSTYIFDQGRFQVANKAVLVPFGEYNPLPRWMGDMINDIFFDGAPDYVASAGVTDYTLNGVSYRNAICYEGTSEALYEGEPQQMILISNNGWVTPSIEPTLQKILLQYYSKKYGTTIYHAANMSPSYTVHNGKIY